MNVKIVCTHQLFSLLLLDTLIAYVHHVTQIKSAKKNPAWKYLNLQLQPPNKFYRFVCFDNDTYCMKSWKKLLKTRARLDSYTKKDIEINSQIIFIDHDLPTVTVSILKILEGKNGDIVALTAFIAIDENRPPVPTKFRKTGRDFE